MKKQFITLSFLALLLTGCSNNSSLTTSSSSAASSNNSSSSIISSSTSSSSMNTYNEITYEVFCEEVQKADADLLDKSYEYVKSNVKGSYSFGETKLENINVTYTKMAVEEGVQFVADTDDETVKRVTDQYYFYCASVYVYTSQFVTMTDSTLKYYKSEQGYMFEGTFKSDFMGMKSDSEVHYEFNIDGVCTRFISSAVISGALEGTSNSVSTNTTMTMTYDLTITLTAAEKEELVD